LDLVFGDHDQTLALEDFVHDRADALPLGQLFIRGHLSGLLVRLRRHLGSKKSVGRARGQAQFLQEASHFADRLAHASGGTEHVEVGHRQIIRIHFPDVMNRHRETLACHLLSELLRNRCAVAEYRGVEVLDPDGVTARLCIHIESPLPESRHFQSVGPNHRTR
jgi:hypothetical protein